MRKDDRVQELCHRRRAGENGTIVRTTDGGTTWAAVNSGVAFTLNKLFWISDNVWAVGNSGTILKSTDSGATWASGASTAPTTNHLKSVYFINSSTGWACGVNTILRTSDGGSSWSKFTDAISATDIFFVDVSTGWFTDDTGGSGFIWTSNDSGVSWTLKKSTTSSLNSLYFINPSTGWAAGIGGTIMITTDNGKSFQSDISSGSANFSSIFISTGGTGFVAGASGAIFKRTAPIRVPEVSTTVIVEQGDFKRSTICSTRRRAKNNGPVQGQQVRQNYHPDFHDAGTSYQDDCGPVH